MKVYGYAHHLTHPSGLGNDAEGNTENSIAIHDGDGDDYSEVRKELPPGTMLRRAIHRMRSAGITDVLSHSLPPHPQSPMGKFMANRCFAGEPLTFDSINARPSPRQAAMWRDCPVTMLTAADDQLFACDGSFEPAIQWACQTSNIIAGSSIFYLAPVIKLLSMTPEGDSDIQHPILRHLSDLVPGYGSTGRSFDIWNTHIVDVLELVHRSVIHGRSLGGLWLSLGGPMLWGENDRAGQGHMYPVRTDAARKALGSDSDIDTRVHGRDLCPVIARRMGRIAEDLIARLSTDTGDFYFHAYPLPAESFRGESMASGTVGVMQELCERLVGCGSKIHIVVSTASDGISDQNTAHVKHLIRRFPSIDFIAGVGWSRRLGTSGAARLSEGYSAIEVGMRDAAEWTVLPAQMRHLNRLTSML